MRPPISHRSRSGVALGLYAATAVLMLYPQSLSPWNTIWFIGDPLTNVYFLGWNAHQLLNDPLQLFAANILHPHGNSALLDSPRLLQSLVVAPVIWATQNPVLGYNMALFLAYVLAAMGGRHLARTLGICEVGAWACGALYAFHTYQISESPRLNVVSHGFLPLALAELVLFLKSGQRRHAWHVAGLMLLQGLADQYHVVYGALLLGLVTAAGLVARPGRVLRRLPRLIPPAIAATLLYLPVLIGYMEASEVYGFERAPSGGIDLRHYLSTSPTNVFYGALGGPVRLGQKLGPHFAGFLSLGLAALSLGALVRGRGEEQTGSVLSARQWVPMAALLGVLFVVLSLGSEFVAFGHRLGPGLYHLLQSWVPGFQYLRLPERLALIAMLFLALLVGRAITLLRRWGWAIPAVALAALVPLEHLSPLPPMGLAGALARLPIRSEVPEVYRWLAHNPARAIAEVPIHREGLERFEILDEYFSTVHLKPTIHGYVSFIPLLTKVLRRAAAVFPSELSLQALQRVGVDTVVVHHGRAGPEGLESELASAVEAGVDHSQGPVPKRHEVGV